MTRSSLARLLALAFVCSVPAVAAVAGAAASRALRGGGAAAAAAMAGAPITKRITETTLTDWLEAAPLLAEFIDETSQSCELFETPPLPSAPRLAPPATAAPAPARLRAHARSPD